MIGAPRRCYGTNELPRLDARLPAVKQAIWATLAPAGIIADGREVHFTFTPCRFGGRRPWLCCQRCLQPRLVLYDHPENKTWECRKCLGLTYPSQRASRDVVLTCQLHVEALWRRFISDWRYGNRSHMKPPRVRWSTWESFCETVDYWETRRHEALIARMERIAVWLSGQGS
jgi:hypothetical protein